MQPVPPRALVTGASEGIGRAFALRLAREGYAVTVVARNGERLASLLAEMRGGGHCAHAVDLSQAEPVARLAAVIAGTHFDLLINNAAAGRYGVFPDLALPDLESMMRLNMSAPVVLAHAFLQAARPGDALINVSSVLACLPMPVNGLYSATKAFITSLSESLWAEQSARGVYVMGLCPGATATQFHPRAGGGHSKRVSLVTQSPEAVVDEALRALRQRRRPTIVTGWVNRVALLLARLLPRWIILREMNRRRTVTGAR